MLPHMSDQYIEGAMYRIQKHQKQDVLASKAALHKVKKAERVERRKSFLKLFKRRSTLSKLPQVNRQHS